MGQPLNSLHIRHYVQSDDSIPRQFDAWYLLTGAPAEPDERWLFVGQATLAARDSMAGAMTGWLAEDSRYLGCTGHMNVEDVIYVAQQINFAGAVGELEGDTSPDYIACVIRRYTEGVGPSSRGRVFIPCVAESNTDTSRLNGDGQTAATAILDALKEEVGPFGEGDIGPHGTPGHFNRVQGGLVEVSHWIVDRVLHSQKRRRLRPLQ